jgi:hypothetical protein
LTKLEKLLLIQFLELKIEFVVDIQHGKKNYTLKMGIILKCDFKIYYIFKIQYSERKHFLIFQMDTFSRPKRSAEN